MPAHSHHDPTNATQGVAPAGDHPHLAKFLKNACGAPTFYARTGMSEESKYIYIYI